MICIVDYGTGNLGSIGNMIKRIGYTSTITNDPNILVNASKIILPGVGSFDFGMKNLIKYKNLYWVRSIQVVKNLSQIDYY